MWNKLINMYREEGYGKEQAELKEGIVQAMECQELHATIGRKLEEARKEFLQEPSYGASF